MAARFPSYGAGRWRVALERLLDPLCPRLCLACDGRVEAGGATLHLCRACRGRLAPLPGGACVRCARPLPGGRARPPICGGCAVSPPPWARLVAVWRYQPPLDAVVRSFKYRRLEFLGAELAAAALPRLAGRLPPIDAALAVPLSWPRRIARGFNQAERFGRPVAAALDIPWIAGLGRRACAPRQVGRSRHDRLARSAGEFRVAWPQRVAGRDLLLIDDVLTTGATAGAASRALLAAGARSVTVLVAAWRPPPGVGGAPNAARRARLDRD